VNQGPKPVGDVSATFPKTVPADAASTRGARFSALMRGRIVAYALVGGGALVVVAAAARWGDAGRVAAALGAWGCAVVTLAWVQAVRGAERDFFTIFAIAHDLSAPRPASILELTPLLGAGNRRSFDHWMTGELKTPHGTWPFGIGHLTARLVTEDAEGGVAELPGSGVRRTLVVVDMAPGITVLPSVYLRPRTGLVDRVEGGDWLAGRDCTRVELESTALSERCEIWCEHDADPLRVRQLFAPTLIDWLASHPLELGFELKAGTLVVHEAGHVDDHGGLVWLMDAAGHLAGVVATEIADARMADRGPAYR
jgi:hypothetical protein